jgi:hypothetical protein
MKRAHRGDPKKLNGRLEKLMKEFLTKLAEASYQVALKLGFRGTFISFLSDLEEALHEVVRKDRSIGHPSHRGQSHERATTH